jgi:hypothetical protein
LSGWEYNRLLQDDPLQPRISALPAASLWRGAHQFWLFRRILCTSESIENECAAADRLGWATGTIVRDLVAEGIIESVDWTRLPPAVIESLRRKQQLLRQEHPDHIVRELIAQRDTTRLEIIKNELLQPVLRHYAATASGAPNSLANWAGTATPTEGALPEREIARLLAKLAAPFLPGVMACKPPGTGLAADVVQRQQEVQNVVEGPLITALTAGDGEFSGPEGFVPYFEALTQHAEVYRPINEQILRDWISGRDRLYRLRDVAETNLWQSLHDEWLPALTSGAMSAADFERRIDHAVSRGPFLRFFDSAPAQTLIGAVPTALATSVAAGTSALAVKAGLNPVEATVAGAAAAAVEENVRRRAAPLITSIQSERTLAVFYQQGKKAIAHPDARM